MAYLVQCDAPGREDAETIRRETREEAMTTATGWQNDGRTGIRIIGDGRVYTAGEFARAFHGHNTP
jgi:hypothetical protein